MSRDADRLFEIASLVSDGQRVDWEGEESRLESAESIPRLRQLRLVSDLSTMYRSMEADDDERATLRMTSTFDLGATAADDPAPTLDAPELWGHLELRERLGEGAFGAVYRAWDRNLEREVALKLLKRDLSKAVTSHALKEGRNLARVRHPNVIQVYGAESFDGRVGLWMELVEGHTLDALIQNQGRFSAREATLIGIELCRALAAVHAAGIVHRDVKAANAMRDSSGRYLLMDFGAGEDRETLAASDGRTISGTPLYIAPEVLLHGESTPQSDLYGLGVLLYFMVTGSYPVTAKTIEELREAHTEQKSQLLRDARPDLPESFVQVVERALRPGLDARWETAGQMEQALSGSLGLEAQGEAPPAPQEPARPGRWIALLALAATIVLALWLLPRLMREDAPAEPTSASAPAGAYTVQAALYRVAGGAREPLDEAATIKVGDELGFEFQATRELYVYIFNEDAQGNAFALFPLPGFEMQNPLPAGQTHILPGRRNGAPLHWQVSSAGGTEHLVVLASPEPLIEFEREMSRLAKPSLESIAQVVSPEARERLRGIGILAEAEAPDTQPESRRLFELARQLSGQAETVEGVWMREIALDNPTP
jgi:hypothetical protein